MRTALLATVWMLLCSAVSFAQYGIDKHRARRAQRRIPEKTLLLTCLAGGWPGALLGGKLFHHKTKKQPYRRLFTLMIAGNIVLMALLLWVLWPVLEN